MTTIPVTHDIFNKMLDGIVIFNLAGIIIEANSAFCGYFHLHRSEIIGKPLSDFVPESKQYKLNRQMDLLAETGKARGNLPIEGFNGTSYFDIVTSIDEESGNYISVFRDVSNETKVKKLSKQSDDLFKELFIESLDGILFWDHKGRIINANYAACRILECNYQELIGTSFKQYIPKQDVSYQNLVETLFEKGAVRDQMRFLLPNGNEKWLEFTSRLHSINGYHMTIIRDVSDRLQMEQELRESEQKFRRVFEGSLEGLILWNDENMIVDINQSACQLLKKTRDSLIGQNLVDLYIQKNRNIEEITQLQAILMEKGHNSGVLPIDVTDETKRYLEFSSIYHLYSNINFTVLKDITDKLEMEERLKKSDTLNVVGELAAGIAHEIRNPMTALKGFIQLLQGSIKEDNAMYFHVILSELSRIDSIINEFLILAKPQVVKYTKVDLTKIMKETVDLLTAQAVMYNVQFLTNYEDSIPNIYCEPNQMKKVFINIIKNAIEVLPSGGEICIGMNLHQEEYLHISIKDDGGGIPKDKLKRLGQPFYTTKDRGTGLGLMVSFKIIEEHNGKIEVESMLGKGTTFHLYLPLQKGGN